MSRHNFLENGFTLFELLVVIAIVAVLTTIAMPSWRATTNEALVQHARLVLHRLAIRQQQFRRRYGRFAEQHELPTLASLEAAVGRRYELRVESASSSYRLILIDPENELPELTLNDLGQWGAPMAAFQ